MIFSRYVIGRPRHIIGPSRKPGQAFSFCRLLSAFHWRRGRFILDAYFLMPPCLTSLRKCRYSRRSPMRGARSHRADASALQMILQEVLMPRDSFSAPPPIATADRCKRDADGGAKMRSRFCESSAFSARAPRAHARASPWRGRQWADGHAGAPFRRFRLLRLSRCLARCTASHAP